MKYIVLVLVILSFLSCGTKHASRTEVSSDTQTQMKKVLVYTKTLGWRHKSIEKGVETFHAFAKAHNLKLTHTEDSLLFTNEFLPQYDAIIFLNTTGNVLDPKGQEAFEKYIQGGGSFMGIHAAADTEYEWPWYGKLVGAYFESHPNNPNIRTATVRKTDKTHRCTNHLSRSFDRDDEWYNYKAINPDITPVLLLDESSYEGGTNGNVHPIAWYHKYDGGKAFYTGGGHPEEAYDDQDFRKHLEEALLWCLE